MCAVNLCDIRNRLISIALTAVGFIQFRFYLNTLQFSRYGRSEFGPTIFIFGPNVRTYKHTMCTVVSMFRLYALRVLLFLSKRTGFLWVFHVYKVTQFLQIDVIMHTNTAHTRDAIETVVDSVSFHLRFRFMRCKTFRRRKKRMSVNVGGITK